MKAAAALFLLSFAAAAETPKPPRGWIEAPSSLLLYSTEGVPVSEIGLGTWRSDLEDGLIEERRSEGAAAGAGRFAWHWKMRSLIRRRRVDEVLSSSATFSYHGTAGQLLWKNDAVDAVPGLPPAKTDSIGETVLVTEKSFDGWTLAAYAFTGNRVLSSFAGDRIERFDLSKNGRFAAVLWSPQDKPLIYSLFDLKTGARGDLPAADAPLGDFSLGEDGSARFGKKTVRPIK